MGGCHSNGVGVGRLHKMHVGVGRPVRVDHGRPDMVGQYPNVKWRSDE